MNNKIRKAFFIPESLPNLAVRLNATAAQLDKYYYILDHIYTRRFMMRRENQDFVNINAKLLRIFIGKGCAKLFLEALVMEGILECDNVWKTGTKSRGFRFVEPYRSGRFRGVIISNKKFARHIDTLQRQHNERAIGDNAGLERIKTTVCSLTLDVKAARANARTYDGQKQSSRLASIQHFKDKQFFFSRDKQDKRFFHNFVMMSRDTRQFATLNGKPIFQADFSSFQPALLTLFYDYAAPGSDVDIERSRFIRVIQSDFYGFMASALPEPPDLQNAEIKSEFKKQVFKDYLFSSTGKATEIKMAFESSFPILAELIYRIKGAEKGIYKNKFRVLALRLQSAEADMIFDVIIPRLMEKFPEIPLISLHDCIASTVEYMPAIKEEMTRAFMEKVRFSTKVKVSRITREKPSVDAQSAAPTGDRATNSLTAFCDRSRAL